MGKNSRVLRLEDISHTAISRLDRDKTMVIAALSPLEVHGPHLPLGQDMMEAHALAIASAGKIADRRAEWSFLILPPVPVAADALPKTGSVSFPAAVVRDVAYHLLAPFARDGFGRLAFASFHGGPRHICALEAAAEMLKKEFGVPAVSLMSAALSKLLDGGFFMKALEGVEGRRITAEQICDDRHAAFIETSIALFLWPDKVEAGWEALSGSAPGRSDGGSFLFSRGGGDGVIGDVRRALETLRSILGVTRHFRNSTYFGYPALSSAEAGRAIFDLLSDLSADLGEELIDRGMGMDGHSPLWRYRGVFLNALAGKAADFLYR